MILSLTAAATVEAKPAPAQPAHAKPAPAADAQGEPAAEADDAAANEAASDADTMPPHIVGPKHVDLGNSSAIELPDGMVLLERNAAQDLLRKNGEPPDNVVAMVFKPGSDWHVFIEYESSGFVDDSDADDLDARELLDSYREGTVEQNKTRKAHGQSELFIDSWSEPPRYERASHHLVWGILAHNSEGKVVNHFTRILGRSGYLAIDLIDAPERLEAAKKEAQAILDSTHFNPGSTYADHVSSDSSSGIGLRGLVLGAGGVAVASKLGLLAKLLLVFKKAFLLIGAAIAGLFRWLFRRKSAAARVSSSAPPADPPPGDSPAG
ncbi:MAG TPA: DUF2167 domain-containing protein [Kofleriaceae bacterium]|nr:DUF2167 domain-containing protein [Kofleriaceae bacterium]